LERTSSGECQTLPLVAILFMASNSFTPLTKLTDGSYEFQIPRYHPTSVLPFVWVEQALGASVLALFKNYRTRQEEILGKLFYVANARTTYPELAAIAEKGM
jgi:hypothetical protein